MRTVFLSSFALSVFVLLLPSVGVSQVDDGTSSTHVRTSDLDLSSRAGQRKLDLRIYRAAQRVCDEPDGLRMATQCVSETVRQARPKRDSVIAMSESNRTKLSDDRVADPIIDITVEPVDYSSSPVTHA